jgi:hypothetical protein
MSERPIADYAFIGRDKRADSVSEDDLIRAASKPVPHADPVRRQVIFKRFRIDAHDSLDLEAGEQVMSVEYDGANREFTVVVMTRIDG